MKITNFTVIFLLIVIPLMLILHMRAEDTNTFAKLNNRYDEAMITATHDSADQLRMNAIPDFESGYSSKKFSRINKEAAYDTFVHTLAINFETQDEITEKLLERYIPVYSIIEYDGLSLNVFQQYNNEDGMKVTDRVWLPKIPFTHHDEAGNIIQFTLDEYVTAYDSGLDEWIEGDRRELLADEDINIGLLEDADLFDRIRRDTIVNTLQENFAFYINEHNVYMKNIGITYTFALPLIPQEDWYNTVDDVGIFAFLQGYPFKRAEGVFNEYGFAGSRLIKEDSYYATIINGKKVFFAESCDYDYQVLEVYSSKKDAAKAGYFELDCLNN